MFALIDSCISRVNRKPKSLKICPKLSEAAAGSVIEMLEGRRLLSVSATALAGPIGVAGNSWTYQISDDEGVTGSEILTSRGATTFQNQPAIEVDAAFFDADGTSAGGEQLYYAFLPQGLVLLGSQATGSGGAGDKDVWSSPYHLILPQTINANSPFMTPLAMATETQTAVGGAVTTSTYTKTDTITLQSDTPNTSVTVAAGTFTDCYEFSTTEIATYGTESPTTDVTQTYVSVTKGVVETNDLTVGTTMQLTSATINTSKLVVQSPGATNTLVGDSISPITVELLNPQGNVDTDSSDAVTITPTLTSNNGATGTLSGATPITTSNGFATFSGLSINKPGQYTLTFTDSAGHVVQSGPFQVAIGKLVFKDPIKNAIAGSSLDPAVEVDLVNGKGQLVTDAPSLVTLNITGTNSSNPITGNTAELSNGIAIFPSIKLTTPGMYTLVATDAQSDVSGMSNEFEIAGPHLDITQQPAKVGVGGRLRYKIELKNSKNDLINNSNDFVTFTLNPMAGATGTLSTVSDILTFGVADNSSSPYVSIDAPGEYTLTATLYSNTTGAPVLDGTTPIEVTSKPFQVAADQLKFTKPVLTTGVNIPLSYEVTLNDYKGKKVASSDQLRFNLITVSGGTGAVLAGGVDSLLGGVAENTGGIPRLSINVPGVYKLAVIDVPPNGESAAKGAISGEFKVK